jgi:type II secretory pathway component PulF
MRLAYKAFDKAGHEFTDVIEAANQAEASQKLRDQDLYVAQIGPAQQAVAKPSSGWHWPRSKMSRLRTLALLTRQLFSLIKSGTPLTQGLASLERQMKDPHWRAVLTDIRTKVERGSGLSAAMAAHRDCFDNIFVSMVAAGEASGQLPLLLDRLASLTRKRAHVIGTIRGAMIYPILLACVATIAITVILIFIVPRFAELFDSLGTPIPPTTAMLISFSKFLQAFWWCVFPTLAGALIVLKIYLKSASGKRFTDTAILSVPKIGKIVKSFETARIIRLLGILSESHLPVQDTLRLTKEATSNVHYAELLARAEESVAHGGDISATFRATNLISDSASEILHTGEQSGQVGPLLMDLADFFDEENETTLKSLTGIIEPVMLVMMAAVVGFVAISIFMPMFDVTALSGGKH